LSQSKKHKEYERKKGEKRAKNSNEISTSEDKKLLRKKKESGSGARLNSRFSETIKEKGKEFNEER